MFFMNYLRYQCFSLEPLAPGLLGPFLKKAIVFTRFVKAISSYRK